MTKFTIAAMFTISLFSFAADAEAQLFNRGGNGGMFQRHQIPSDGFINSPYNAKGRPLRGFQAQWVAKRHAWDAQKSARTGIPAEQIAERRIRRLNNFAAALAGAGDGLMAASNSFSAAPSTFGANRGYSGNSLPSNFHLRMQQNAFNRSYSSNPNHASAYGY